MHDSINHSIRHWRPYLLTAALLLIATGLKSQAQDRATPPSEIEIADGFHVELLYSVPLAEQRSWICMTADDSGRIICSDQRGGLYRVTLGKDSRDSAEQVKVEPLEIEIGEAQGLLYAYDSLYVTVCGDSAQGTGFYRVKDTNGDDQFDEVTLLQKFELGTSSTDFRRDIKSRVQEFLIRGGHGPHGICLGPDGLLYLIGGNHTKLPSGVNPESPYRNFAEDLLLPRIPDAQGIATGIEAPGGWVMRTDKEGKDWSLFCGGLRNGYDLAFDSNGELFTFDADMEFDTGTPWYRPCRINHLVSGGEYGWRYGSGKWPEYNADSLGAVVNVGLASPTGVAFGTNANFPVKYQQAMFVGDWAYGKVFAVHLTPHGSSYRGNYEVFLKGKPLAVTDLMVHTDGAMYFLIGGRGTQSGLYRVTHALSDSPKVAGENIAQTDDQATRQLREQRHDLEQYHDLPSATPNDVIAVAWPYLNHIDRNLRFAARVAVESRPIAEWIEQARDEVRADASIQVAIALARLNDPSYRDLAVEKLTQLSVEDLTERQRLDCLRAHALILSRLGRADTETLESISEPFLKLLPSSSPLVNREAVRLLVSLEHPDVVDKAMKILLSSTTQEDQLFYLFVLRNMKAGWTIENRRLYYGLLRRAFTDYQGGSSFQGFVRTILQQSSQLLSAEERKSVGAIVGGRETLPTITSLATPRQFVQNWQMDEFLPLIGEVDQGRDFKRGKQAYLDSRCNACHRFAGAGGVTGPDLTGVGSRFSPRYILEAILEPSEVIPDEYRSWNLLTADQKILSGRIVEENEEHVVLRTDPYALENVSVAKDEIEQRALSRVSEMPQGQVNVLSRDEILDLVAYLRSGGDADDKAFADTPKPADKTAPLPGK